VTAIDVNPHLALTIVINVPQNLEAATSVNHNLVLATNTSPNPVTALAVVPTPVTSIPSTLLSLARTVLLHLSHHRAL
jgi:hypothetical protein